MRLQVHVLDVFALELSQVVVEEICVLEDGSLVKVLPVELGALVVLEVRRRRVLENVVNVIVFPARQVLQVLDHVLEASFCSRLLRRRELLPQSKAAADFESSD